MSWRYDLSSLFTEVSLSSPAGFHAQYFGEFPAPPALENNYGMWGSELSLFFLSPPSSLSLRTLGGKEMMDHLPDVVAVHETFPKSLKSAEKTEN